MRLLTSAFICTVLFSTISFAGDVGILSIGSGYASISKTKPVLTNELSGGANLYLEIDAANNNFTGPHYAYRKTYAESDAFKLSITTHELGISFILPFPLLDIILGVGYINGGAMAEDKTTSFEDRKNINGYFARGALDFMLHKNFGIRGSYQASTMRLKDFSPTDDLDINQNIFGIGLVARGIDGF